VDKEGDDRFYSQADALMGTSPSVHKGTFAYDFSQASLYGTNAPPVESLPVVATNLCTQVVCINQGIGFDCRSQIAQVAFPAGLPVTGPPTAVSQNPCDQDAVALLVKLVGRSTYTAGSYAFHNNQGCDWGSWAVTSAQGSAPTKGLAALVDLGVDTSDAFAINAKSDSVGCQTLGVRSATYGQGFGGAILWDHWDAPPFAPLLIGDLALGALVRGTGCGQDGATAAAVQAEDPCSVGWGSDSYSGVSRAINAASGVAWSQSRVQGSGNGVEADPFGVTYNALGVGLHADAFGDDRFNSQAFADGPVATLQPFVVAQGAGIGAVGILANVQGTDRYFALPYLNGVPPAQPSPLVFAQADAQAVPVAFTVCTPGGLVCDTLTINLAAGILVDAMGGDAYNMVCPSNGSLLGPYGWGNFLLSSCAPAPWSSGLIQGLDA
jgi:hypothetical protein